VIVTRIAPNKPINSKLIDQPPDSRLTNKDISRARISSVRKIPARQDRVDHGNQTFDGPEGNHNHSIKPGQSQNIAGLYSTWLASWTGKKSGMVTAANPTTTDTRLNPPI
jgi:hypothetical protein